MTHSLSIMTTLSHAQVKHALAQNLMNSSDTGNRNMHPKTPHSYIVIKNIP